jgi:pimeloyl-ACP methyl ester carboxylesterase
MCVGGGGRITFDYDMHIADPLAQGDGVGGADLWPAFAALAGRPVLALRGELSDILSDATFRRMADTLPGCETVTVGRVGHAPTLEEPEALAAIARLLEKVA